MQKKRSLWNRLPSLDAKEYLLILVFTSLLVLLPYFAVQTLVGHDMLFHLDRIEGLAEAYRHADAFPAIFYNVFDGVGYGTPLFYGNLAVALPAALCALGVPLLAAWKINIFLIALFASLSCFLCAREMLRNDYAAFLMSMVFVFSGYFAADVFFRATLGEMASFIFIPVAFLGLYGILHERKGLWPLLPLGLSLILYCHLLSALITAFGLLLFALFQADEFFRRPKKLLLLLASAGLFLLCSAFFILPAFEQLSSASFLATDGSSAVVYGTLAERAMPWWSLASDVNILVHSLSAALIPDWIPNGLGLALPLMLFAAAVFGRRMNSRKALSALILCVLTLWLCSDLFPWRAAFVQDTLGIIQFPWRFLLLAVFFLALFVGEFAAAAEKTRVARIVCKLFIIFSLIGFALPAAQEFAVGLHHSFSGDTVQYAYENEIGTGEYLPSGLTEHTFPDLQQGASSSDADMNVTDLGETDGVRSVEFSGGGSSGDAVVTINLFYRSPVSAAVRLPDGSVSELAFTQTDSKAYVAIGDLTAGTILLSCEPMVRASSPGLAASADVTLGYGSATVAFSGAQSGDWIEVPLLWYKGYAAHFTAEDGSVSVLSTSAGTLGLCRVNLDGAAGTVTVRYERTPLQLVSLAVSAAAFVGMAAWGVLAIIKTQKRTGRHAVSESGGHDSL